MSRKQIRNLSQSIKESIYTKLRRSVYRRGKTFEKKGLSQPVPASLRNMPTVRNASQRQIDDALSYAESYMTGTIYTAAGYQKYLNEQRTTWGERMGLDRPLTKAEHERFGRFMGDMQKRMGSNWDKVSSQAAQMFAEAMRLNLNVNQFRRNFDYWSDHIDKLKDAKPINRSSGVKPSDYIKQLKLETVTSWKKRF